MSQSTLARRTAPNATPRVNLYQEITDRIIAQLEAGRVPWVQPWGNAALPRNAATGRGYSGINILILWGALSEHGFSGQLWLTYRQAQALGGQVRKGERGTAIVYADRFTPEKERACAVRENREAASIPFLKRFTVFNAAQCENLPAHLAAAAPAPEQALILPQAEALIRATGAAFRIGGGEAFYMPAEDRIQVPPPQAFFEPVNWHRTAFHELGHWTGHTSRLACDMTNAFGSPGHAREELVAEMAAAFVCAALGISPTVRHADYLGEWLAVLREDNRAILRAASAASKAADYLLAFRVSASLADPSGIAAAF